MALRQYNKAGTQFFDDQTGKVYDLEDDGRYQDYGITIQPGGSYYDGTTVRQWGGPATATTAQNLPAAGTTAATAAPVGAPSAAMAYPAATDDSSDGINWSETGAYDFLQNPALAGAGGDFNTQFLLNQIQTNGPPAGVTPLSNNIPSFQDWLQTPQGQAMSTSDDGAGAAYIKQFYSQPEANPDFLETWGVPIMSAIGGGIGLAHAGAMGAASGAGSFGADAASQQAISDAVSAASPGASYPAAPVDFVQNTYAGTAQNLPAAGTTAATAAPAGAPSAATATGLIDRTIAALPKALASGAVSAGLGGLLSQVDDPATRSVIGSATNSLVNQVNPAGYLADAMGANSGAYNAMQQTATLPQLPGAPSGAMEGVAPDMTGAGGERLPTNPSFEILPGINISQLTPQEQADYFQGNGQLSQQTMERFGYGGYGGSTNGGTAYNFFDPGAAAQVGATPGNPYVDQNQQFTMPWQTPDGGSITQNTLGDQQEIDGSAQTIYDQNANAGVPGYDIDLTSGVASGGAPGSSLATSSLSNTNTFNPTNNVNVNVPDFGASIGNSLSGLLSGFNANSLAQAGILAAASKYAADQQRGALEGVSGRQDALAREMLSYGAPARARLEAAQQPGFSMFNLPGYGDAADRAAEIASRKWSTQGNPYGNPTLQAGIYRDVLNERVMPDYFNYLNLQGNQGGLGGAMGAASSAFSGGNQASLLAAQTNPFAGYGAAIRTAFDNPLGTQNNPYRITVGGLPT